MIEKIAVTILGRASYDALKKLFQDNRSAIDKAYSQALETAEDWYASTYADQFGTKNNRFFDYQGVADELEKLIFYFQKTDTRVIEEYVNQRHISVPPDVIQSFVTKLKQEMIKNREIEALLARRDHFQNTADTAKNTADMVKLQEKQLALLEKAHASSCPAESADTPELDWRKLFEAFKLGQLDKIKIKQIGEGKSGPEMLDLGKVFFEQDVGLRAKVFFSFAGEKAHQQKHVQQFMQQTEIWKSCLWRHQQENRLKMDLEERVDHEEAAKQLLKITEKLFLLVKGAPARLSGRQFSHILDQASADLDMTVDQIVVVLNWYFETSMTREPVLKQLKAPCSGILVGDAGSGKTTAMRKMCMDLFKTLAAKEDPSLPVPVFVRLDTVYEYITTDMSLEQAANALLDYVCAHWKQDLDQQGDLCRSALLKCAHPIQMILDGFDEIPSMTVRRQLAKVVNRLTRDNAFYIIVTSRPAALDQGLRDLFEQRDFQLMELADHQIDAFVEQFYRIYSGEDIATGNQDALAFHTALVETEAAREFAANPLYLTVMMLMHKKHEVLPQRRVELYQEFVNMLLSQRQSEPVNGKVGVKPSFKIELPDSRSVVWADTDYRKLLNRIAYEMHRDEKDSVSITRQRVIDAIKANQSLMRQVIKKNEQDLAGEFIDFCDERLGMMVSRGPYHGFSHRSIQEYFAALRIAGMERAEIIEFWQSEALKRPDRWHEVARLLFCLIHTKDFCFEFLEEQWPDDIKKADMPQPIYMIGAALSDLQGFHPNYDGGIYVLYEGVKQALIEKRRLCVDNPRLFLACGDALGMLNEPAIENNEPPVVRFQASQPFMMGGIEEDEKPVHPVTLSPYWISRYPVTNKQFAEFVNQGGYTDIDNWYDEQGLFKFDGRKMLKERGWKAPVYWHDDGLGKKRLTAPVVGVSWFEAMAFCRWWTKTYGRTWAEKYGLDNVQVRLPTEAEWEFAARGYHCSEYPWGNEDPVDPILRANIDEAIGQTSAVGSFADGATIETGLMDMAGNVWEWCWDWYGSYLSADSPSADPCGPEKGSARVLRGGSWFRPAWSCRSAYRSYFVPGLRDLGGFRLALSPGQPG